VGTGKRWPVGTGKRWTWSKVSAVHAPDGRGSVACDGPVYAYTYRLYPPSDPSFERCVSLRWCSTCREFSGAMVFVPRGEELPDALAGLPGPERERLERSEVKLLDHLDRLVRRGAWPPPRP